MELSSSRASIGTVGDAYDNALAETIIGIKKHECIEDGSPFRFITRSQQLEGMISSLVHWFTTSRSMNRLNLTTPLKTETAHDPIQAQTQPAPALTYPTAHQTRYGSASQADNESSILLARSRGHDCALAWAGIQAYTVVMQTLSISSAKDRLSELVEQSASTAEQFTITRNGAPAAVLVGVDEWESLQETVFWLSQAGIRQDLARSLEELHAGKTLDETAVRAQLGGAKSAP